MSSKAKLINTVGGYDEFEITSTHLVNVVQGDLRRSVSRKDVAKFFKKPVSGEYGDSGLPRIATTYDEAYCDYLGNDEGYTVAFQIFLDSEKHFNIGCMEFGKEETSIIRRWAKSSLKKKVVTKSSTKAVAKKSSRRAA